MESTLTWWGGGRPAPAALPMHTSHSTCTACSPLGAHTRFLGFWRQNPGIQEPACCTHLPSHVCAAGVQEDPLPAGDPLARQYTALVAEAAAAFHAAIPGSQVGCPGRGARGLSASCPAGRGQAIMRCQRGPPDSLIACPLPV